MALNRSSKYLIFALTMLLVAPLSFGGHSRASRRRIKELCRASLAGARVPDAFVESLRNLVVIGRDNGDSYTFSVPETDLWSSGKILISWEVHRKNQKVGTGSLEVGTTGEYFSDFRSYLNKNDQGEGITSALLHVVATHAKPNALLSMYSLNGVNNRQFTDLRCQATLGPEWSRDDSDVLLAYVKELASRGSNGALPLWVRTAKGAGFEIEKLEIRPEPEKGTIEIGRETYYLLFRKL